MFNMYGGRARARGKGEAHRREGGKESITQYVPPKVITQASDLLPKAVLPNHPRTFSRTSILFSPFKLTNLINNNNFLNTPSLRKWDAARAN